MVILVEYFAFFFCHCTRWSCFLLTVTWSLEKSFCRVLAKQELDVGYRVFTKDMPKLWYLLGASCLLCGAKCLNALL